MTREEVEQTVRRVLGDIAPEADTARIKANVSLRDQLDIDSMDFLNFVIALHKELGVEVPESDYARLSSGEGCVEYLAAALKV